MGSVLSFLGVTVFFSVPVLVLGVKEGGVCGAHFSSHIHRQFHIPPVQTNISRCLCSFCHVEGSRAGHNLLKMCHRWRDAFTLQFKAETGNSYSNLTSSHRDTNVSERRSLVIV